MACKPTYLSFLFRGRVVVRSKHTFVCLFKLGNLNHAGDEQQFRGVGGGGRIGRLEVVFVCLTCDRYRSREIADFRPEPILTTTAVHGVFIAMLSTETYCYRVTTLVVSSGIDSSRLTACYLFHRQKQIELLRL